MNGNELAKSFYLLRKFEEVNIKQNQSFSFLSKLLSIYNLPAPISKKIIFHSLSQSWILALTKQFKNKLIEEGNLQFGSISFECIFLFFCSTPVNLNYFYDNMKKCVYRSNHTTLSLMEFKLAQVFIEKIEENKQRRAITGETNPHSKKEFEERMMRLVVITVNHTLNEINYQEENKSSLLLYKTFNSIYNKDLSKTCKYQLFMNQIIKAKEKDNSKPSHGLIEINTDSSLAKAQNNTLYNIQLAKLFFALANTNYVDLLSDVRYFVFKTSAWNQKIGLIVKNMVNNKNNVLFRFAYFTIKNIIDAVYHTGKSISSPLSTELSIDLNSKNAPMSITQGVCNAFCSVQAIICSIIDWNVGKLNEIKNTSLPVLYSAWSYFSLNQFKSNSLNMSKKSLCERCSCLYLSHFSFEYESSYGSRSNSVVSEI